MASCGKFPTLRTRQLNLSPDLRIVGIFTLSELIEPVLSPAAHLGIHFLESFYNQQLRDLIKVKERRKKIEEQENSPATGGI